MKLLLTTGGTREPIDAVRYIGNRSSGRMGVAIAEAAREAGWDVTSLVCGDALRPEGHTVEVGSAAELEAALAEHWPAFDVLVMAAAVSDYTPATTHAGKLRRGEAVTLELVPTPDLVAGCAAAKRPGQRVVAFSLDEPGEAALARASQKLVKKGVDLLVYNPLDTMAGGDVSAILLTPDDPPEALRRMSKQAFAAELVRRVGDLVRNSSAGPG